jgi:hypothetical protein
MDAEYSQPVLVLLLVIVNILHKLRVPGDLLIFAAGHFEQTRNRALLEAGINIIASTAFTIKYGMFGVLMGAICSYSFRTLDIIIYSGRKIVKDTILQSLIKIIICGLCYSLVVIFAMKFIPYTGNTFAAWVSYAAGNGILLAIPVGIYLLIRYRRLVGAIK